MDWKWVVSIVALLGASSGILLAWPIVRAENLYAVAEANYDSMGKCKYAGTVAEAWGAISMESKYSEWKDLQGNLCAYANVRGH